MRPILFLVAMTVFAVGCGKATVTCRAPKRWSTPVEGKPDAYCSLTFSACEDSSLIDVSCTNNTFSGDYDCRWSRVAGLVAQAGTFRSAEFCRLGEAAMTAQLGERTPLEVTVK